MPLTRTLVFFFATLILQEPAAEAPAAVNGEAPVAADGAAAVESSAPNGDEGPKRVVSRERHTLFVGNLPFGKYRARPSI